MTTTELAVAEPSATVSLIQQTALDLAAAHQIATALARTAFVPKVFQGRPDDAAAAILYGASIAMDPLTALQNVYVIGGKPALYARAMVAVVLAQGHEIWTEEEDEGRVTVAGRRKGADHVERVTWTLEMATKAGYTTNAKYRTDPRSMLYARASGDVARRVAPDALLGMAYSAEELMLEAEVPPAAPPSASGAARLRAAMTPATPPVRALPAVEAAPAAEDEPVPPSEAEQVQGVAMVTGEQAKKLHAALNRCGYTRREDKLAYVSELVRREITTSADLTLAEASRLIDYLEQPPAEDEPDPEH